MRVCKSMTVNVNVNMRESECVRVRVGDRVLCDKLVIIKCQ